MLRDNTEPLTCGRSSLLGQVQHSAECCHFSLPLIDILSAVTKEIYFCSYKSLENHPLPHLCPQSLAIKSLGKEASCKVLCSPQLHQQTHYPRGTWKGNLGSEVKRLNSSEPQFSYLQKGHNDVHHKFIGTLHSRQSSHLSLVAHISAMALHHLQA